MSSLTDSLFRIGSGEWEAGISDFAGGNIAFLRYRGVNILRPLLSEEELNMDPFRHGSPVLLPANRTRNGRFSFRGKEYVLPSLMHGLVSSSRFLVMEHGENRITLSLEAGDGIYPFPFRLSVDYVLDGNGIICTYTLLNTGDGDMPFTFGLHTTFDSVDTFRVPVSRRMETAEGKIPTGNFLPLTGDELSYSSGCVNRGKFSGFYSSLGNRALVNGNVAFEVSENFDYWTLFAPGQGKMLCIEPQCGSVNGLNLGDAFFRILPEGESILFRTHIFVI